MSKHLDETWLIENGVGVRGQDQAGHAAGKCCVDLGLEGVPVCVARFAQTRGKVNQPGQDGKAGRVHDAIRGEVSWRRSNGDDTAPGDVDVLMLVDRAGGIDESAVFYVQL